jgi:NADPH-dependent glutamate synthase beta subunit-like oxidoreductase
MSLPPSAANIPLTIDGRKLEVPAGTTILEAARAANVYIPVLCHHPDLPSAEGGAAASAVYHGSRRIENAQPGAPGSGCGICVVALEGSTELVAACATVAEAGMAVVTGGARVKAARQEKLVPILARHRHACLTCTQQAGCSRSQCSANVPENERCCPRFGHCELQNVARHVGILPATPRWVPDDVSLIEDLPLFVRDHSLCIECTRCVRACRDLRGVEAIGFAVDAGGRVRVGTLAEGIEASGCKFCTACVAVCPTGALTDKGVRAATREEDLVPCRAACPAGIDVPGYVRMIARGQTAEAYAIIREKVPFPEVLGRVCPHPCEEACRRGEVNAPIAICALKRHAADGARRGSKPPGARAPGSGEKVAVVGAGPAGLTAAFYLRRKGHAVTVFEAEPLAGGMLRYGIPEYRLPRPVLDREIQAIWDSGVDFRPGRALGRDFTLEGLKQDGFAAVFLGLGAQFSRRIALQGSDLPDVLRGGDFLRRAAIGERVALKDNVVVVGGGNLAVDAARTALRCGARQVYLACLEPVGEMPAGAGEIEAAVAEGVTILPRLGPERVVSEEGRVTGLDLVECTCVFDGQGNFCPQFGARKECLPVDQVILAVGQGPDLAFLGVESRIRVARGLIVARADTGETGLPGVFAGGDVAQAPGSVIQAVAAGRRAAESIDKALGGDGVIDAVLFARGAPEPRLGCDKGFSSWAREAVPERDPAVRRHSFAEISLGLGSAQAVREARRCLQCDLRLTLRSNPAPPASLLPFDAEHILRVPEGEGVFRLLDAGNKVVSIKGTATLRQDLTAALEDGRPAAWFEFEEEKMYSRRESELLQAHLQEHGEMPVGGDDLDDLY